jgi:DNA-binding XRE family transcriptional regulator
VGALMEENVSNAAGEFCLEHESVPFFFALQSTSVCSKKQEVSTMKSRNVQREVEVFALRLREVRQKRGVTQQALAERAEMSLTYLNNLEHGLKIPSLTTILRLAVALNCKVMDLVGAYDKTDIRSLLSK